MESSKSSTPAVLRGTFALSRFAYLHVVDETFVLASPRTDRRVPISNSVLALLFRLRKPVYLPEFLGGFDNPMRSRLSAILKTLWEEQFIIRVDKALKNNGEENTSTEASRAWDGESCALRTWEFHDLLYHSQSRHGRAHQRLGGTYRFNGKTPPVLAAKQYPDRSSISLSRPDLADLKASDPSFTQVMERRTSTRAFGATPLTIAQISEFLFRTCRVKTLVSSQGGAAFTRRVYPSGGSMYPLEIYVLAHTCEGLESDLYHYDALNHVLTPLEVGREARKTLLHDAKQAANLEGTPPILLSISARFARTAYKYQSIAYSLILKEVGVLYQTMWLAASAMNIAACGLGAGNSDVFAHAVGSNYYAETSVGEFILGSMP